MRAAAAEDFNVFAFLELIIEPRLASASRWFVVADPAQIDGLAYAYLDGAPGPQTDQQAGFDVDGIRFRIRLDFGAGWTDFRGWYRIGCRPPPGPWPRPGRSACATSCCAPERGARAS